MSNNQPQGASNEAKRAVCSKCGTYHTHECLGVRTPAATGAAELPPLPPHIEVGGEGWTMEDFESWKTFTAEQMQEYALAAIAADRAQLAQQGQGKVAWLGRDGRMTNELRSFMEGMSVSMDVSTGEHDAGNRYFGIINEVMDDDGDKNGVTLLVYEAHPNFAAPASAQPADPLAAVRSLAEKWNQDAIKDGFAGSEPAFELLEVLEAGAQPDQRESANNGADEQKGGAA